MSSSASAAAAAAAAFAPPRPTRGAPKDSAEGTRSSRSRLGAFATFALGFAVAAVLLYASQSLSEQRPHKSGATSAIHRVSARVNAATPARIRAAAAARPERPADDEYEYYDDEAGAAGERQSSSEGGGASTASALTLGDAAVPLPLSATARTGAAVTGEKNGGGSGRRESVESVGGLSKAGGDASDTSSAPGVPDDSLLDSDAPPPTPRQRVTSDHFAAGRPARTPPDWLLAGSCVPPPPSAASARSDSLDSASAFGSFHEERHGETLLGECSCPLLNGAAPEFPFDCGDYDWRILSDLAPWHGVNLSHVALDLAYNTQTANIPPGYHFSINKNRVYMRMRDPTSVYHGQLLDMLRTVARTVMLPDVEFVLHAWDHAKVWRQDPIPVFSFIRDAAKNDITVPYPYTWGAGDFNVAVPGCSEWSERAGKKVIWRGGCTGPVAGYLDPFWPAYIRYRANVATREHPDVLDAGLSEACAREGATPLSPVDTNHGACNHQYLLLLDGNTASGRSARYMHAGAVLLKPDSVFSEWYYHLLRPWVHYVPVREFLEDLGEQAEWAVRDAPPRATQCMRDNLNALAKRHINKEAVACYWWRLLSTWKRQQPEESRTDGFQEV